MFCLSAVAILLVSASQAMETEDLFVSGTLDASQPYPVFRIPALCRTASGTLLAFAEARRAINDQSSNILVLRRRPGRAKQWGPLQIIAEDRLASLNNPCVLVDGRSVWLMYQRYPYGYNERTASAGLEPEQSCRTFVISSSDDGKTWTAPTELTATVKRPGIRSDASGPGIGIVLRRGAHAGRLVFPLNEGADGAYTAFSVYSDDRGATWRRGAPVPKANGLQPNETQFVELTDGRVLLNARNQASERRRIVSVSNDGGETWDKARAVAELVDPVCMGSIVRVSFRPNLILFSNAADAKERVAGTVRSSSDDGRTWVIEHAITDAKSSFQYSCLCPLPDHRVGILYETREISPDGKEGYRIRYTSFRTR